MTKALWTADGEGLTLGNFDANETGGWVGQDGKSAYDSSGTMVCVTDADPESPLAACNASTCECQSWDYVKHNNTAGRLEAFWYCEVGPGWKPPPAEILTEQESRRLAAEATTAASALADGFGLGEFLDAVAETQVHPLLGWVPSAAPCMRQWLPAPLKAATASTVEVDLSRLAGKTPVAIRLGWPLGMLHGLSDTCCPSAAVQSGFGACIPGSCPLYSSVSNLPANPFFAKLAGGKCECLAPQTCDE